MKNDAMAVTSVDFLKAAKKLADRPTEAERRTAVGRAYYAAFHHARAYLMREGVALPSARSHDALRKALRLKDEVAATLIGALQKQRVKADYRLQETVGAQETHDAIRAATSLLARLG